MREVIEYGKNQSNKVTYLVVNLEHLKEQGKTEYFDEAALAMKRVNLIP